MTKPWREQDGLPRGQRPVASPIRTLLSTHGPRRHLRGDPARPAQHPARRRWAGTSVAVIERQIATAEPPPQTHSQPQPQDMLPGRTCDAFTAAARLPPQPRDREEWSTEDAEMLTELLGEHDGGGPAEQPLSVARVPGMTPAAARLLDSAPSGEIARPLDTCRLELRAPCRLLLTATVGRALLPWPHAGGLVLLATSG